MLHHYKSMQGSEISLVFWILLFSFIIDILQEFVVSLVIIQIKWILKSAEQGLPCNTEQEQTISV